MRSLFLPLFCFLFSFANSCHAQPDLPDAGRGEQLQINSIRFSPDGKLLAAGIGKLSGGIPRAQEIRVWETATGQLLWSQADEANFGSLVAFSPDGKKVVLNGIMLKEQTLRGSRATVWDARSGERLSSLETAGSETVWSLVFSLDGTQLIGVLSTGVDSKNTGVIKFWDAHTGKPVRSLEADFNLSASLEFSGDGRFLLFKSWRIEQDKTWQSRIVFRELPQYNVSNTIQLENVLAYLSALSPDNETLAVNCYVMPGENMPPSFELSLWKRATGKQELVLLPDAENYRIGTIAFSPDGKQLVASGIVIGQKPGGALWIWDTRSGELLKSLNIEIKTEELTRNDFRTMLAPDGKSIAVPVASDKIELRNLQDGALIRAFE